MPGWRARPLNVGLAGNIPRYAVTTDGPRIPYRPSQAVTRAVCSAV